MGTDTELVELSRRPAAVVRAHVRPAGLADFFAGAFEEVLDVVDEQGLVPTGPPFARHLVAGDGFDVTAGFPVDGAVLPSGRVLPDGLPGGTAATTMHVGAYDALGATYAETTRWLAEHGLRPEGTPWEVHLDGPSVPRPRTRVVVPCRPEE